MSSPVLFNFMNCVRREKAWLRWIVELLSGHWATNFLLLTFISKSNWLHTQIVCIVYFFFSKECHNCSNIYHLVLEFHQKYRVLTLIKLVTVAQNINNHDLLIHSVRIRLKISEFYYEIKHGGRTRFKTFVKSENYAAWQGF